MKNQCLVCKLAMVLVTIGALNWGLVGIFQFNAVDSILGEMSILSRVVYALVGVSGLMSFIGWFKECPKCKKEA